MLGIMTAVMVSSCHWAPGPKLSISHPSSEGSVVTFPRHTRGEETQSDLCDTTQQVREQKWDKPAGSGTENLENMFV